VFELAEEQSYCHSCKPQDDVFEVLLVAEELGPGLVEVVDAYWCTLLSPVYLLRILRSFSAARKDELSSNESSEALS
jgi:hypothetical protein